MRRARPRAPRAPALCALALLLSLASPASPMPPLARRSIGSGVGGARSLQGSASMLAPPASPTLVWTSFTFNRVGALDPVAGTFDVDGFLSLSWVDPRLNLSGGANSQDLSQCEAFATGAGPEPAFFVPWVELVNMQVHLISTPPRWSCFAGAPVFVGAPAVAAAYNISGGAGPGAAAAAAGALQWLTLYARVAGNFFAPFALADFPFDRQSAPVMLESRDWAADALRFRAAPQGFDAVLPPGLAVQGFVLVSAATAETLHYYPAFLASYSQLAISVVVVRNSAYYLFKAGSNVILLVLMSLLAALLRPQDANRAVIQLTVFMGIVSWVFVLSNDSPRSQQLTRMDMFMLASFAAVFVLYVYYSVTFALKEKEAKVKERKRTASAHAIVAAARLPTPSVVGAFRNAIFGGAGGSGGAGAGLPGAAGNIGGAFGVHVGVLAEGGAATPNTRHAASPLAEVDEDAASVATADAEDNEEGAADSASSAAAAAGAGAKASRAGIGAAGVPTGRSALDLRSPRRAVVANPLVVAAGRRRVGRAPAPASAAATAPARRGSGVSAAGGSGRDSEASGGGGPACCACWGLLAGRDEGGMCAARACACVPLRFKSSIRLRDLLVTMIVLCVYVAFISSVLQPPPTPPA